jgi:predicted PolB exonuclease-like 3'-5' exonuclease|tara:strand:+ start:1746 stop:2522 length:777 start_codon:yes stop_codon:yes gene_type:complete
MPSFSLPVLNIECVTYVEQRGRVKTHCLVMSMALISLTLGLILSIIVTFKGGNMVTFFDVEAVARTDIPDECLPKFKAPANIKDPDKIKARQKEFYIKSKQGLAKDPWTAKIVCLQMLTPEGTWYGSVGSDEVGILEMFWERVQDSSVYVGGFNIIGYDLPLIYIRSILHKVKPSRKFILNRYNSDVLDVMYKLCSNDLSKAKKLDYYCNMFHLGKKSGQGEEVAKLFKEGKLVEIESYCRVDVQLTKDLSLLTQTFF